MKPRKLQSFFGCGGKEEKPPVIAPLGIEQRSSSSWRIHKSDLFVCYARAMQRWATGWTIGVLGFDSRRGLGILLFTSLSRTALEPIQPPIQWIQWALSLGVKWPGCEADHSPPSTAEVKECVELYLHSPNTPLWHGAQLKHRDNFTFCVLYNEIALSEVELVGRMVTEVKHISADFPLLYEEIGHCEGKPCLRNWFIFVRRTSATGREFMFTSSRLSAHVHPVCSLSRHAA
jgi:hypothetical protein